MSLLHLGWAFEDVSQKIWLQVCVVPEWEEQPEFCTPKDFEDKDGIYYGPYGSIREAHQSLMTYGWEVIDGASFYYRMRSGKKYLVANMKGLPLRKPKNKLPHNADGSKKSAKKQRRLT